MWVVKSQQNGTDPLFLTSMLIFPFPFLALLIFHIQEKKIICFY